MSFTSFFVPVIVAFILCYGLFRRVNVFDVFIRGAMDGAKVAVSILPALIGLLTCVAMFRASGALDFLIALARPVAQVLGFPEELLPLALLRPISGSGGIAILQDILSTYGADSFIGQVASVLDGSAETTFYTIAVYYTSVGVQNTRYTLPAALVADLAGFLLSAVAVRLWLLSR